MVRGLAQHIAESDIEDSIRSCGLQAKDIRLIRKKETGKVKTIYVTCMPCHAKVTNWNWCKIKSYVIDLKWGPTNYLISLFYQRQNQIIMRNWFHILCKCSIDPKINAETNFILHNKLRVSRVSVCLGNNSSNFPFAI